MSIKSIYNNSLLSQMAYSDGLNDFKTGDGLRDQLLGFLSDDGVTLEQAQYFADNFRVVEQEPTTTSGFSATLFQNVHTNEYHFSMRGTDTSFLGIDWTDANLDNVFNSISRDQTIDMLNFYLRLTSSGDIPQYELQRIESREVPTEPYIYPQIVGMGVSSYLVLREKASVNQETVIISSLSNLTLTGHSLGGHLASMFTLLFPNVITDTVTFNSAGFIGWADNEVNDINGLIAATVPQVTNITPYTTGLSTVTDVSSPVDFVSNQGTQLGAPANQFEIDVESVPDTVLNIIDNHAIDRLSDSLAVINFMYTLDNTITIEQANGILQQSANQMNLSLECLMSHFAELFNAPSIEVADSDHNSIYEFIDSVTSESDFEPDQFRIEAAGSNLVSLAQSGDQAALYTLLHVQPFVIRGATQAITSTLYQGVSDDLDVVNYTEQYLHDRSLMLSGLLNMNSRDDTTANIRLDSGFDITDLESGVNVNNIAYINDDAGFDLSVTFGTDVTDGTDGVDDLIGRSDNIDHLYGGGGADTLIGNKGNDYLEGGIGNDTYQFNYGDGRDKIVDNGAEGESNQLLITHEEGGALEAVTNLTLVTDSDVLLYVELDDNGERINNTSYLVIATPKPANPDHRSLLISVNGGAGGLITIDDWAGDTNRFGITIDTQDISPPAPPVTVNGLVAPADYDGLNAADSAVRPWSPQRANSGDSDLSESITGSDFIDDIAGGGGGDLIDSKNSFVPAGFSGDGFVDTIAGGTGLDYLIGGDGIHIIFGGRGGAPYTTAGPIGINANGEFYYASPSEDAEDNDYIEGGAGDDSLSGEEGNDHINAGLDNDKVFGGAGSDLLLGGDGDDVVFGDGVLDIYSSAQLFPNADINQFTGSTVVALISEQDGVHTYDDFIDGGLGNDRLVGGLGNDTVVGGKGDDTIQGDHWQQGSANTLSSIDTRIDLSTGNTLTRELISAQNLAVEDYGNDTLLGGAGSDIIYGQGGSDFIDGGNDDDELYGDDFDADTTAHGADTLLGGEGNDQLAGNGGNDTLYGGVGNDVIFGDDDGFVSNALTGQDHGDDYLDGGDGNDELSGDGGSDEIFGGAGDDLIFGDTSGSGSMLASEFQGDDYLDGGDGADRLWGDGGDDELLGGAGNDQLIGGEGNDTLVGGTGVDVLGGGAGDDRYIFNLGDATDRRSDGTGDTIIDASGNNTLVINGISIKDLSILIASNLVNIRYGNDEVIVLQDSSFIAISRFQIGQQSYSHSELIAELSATDDFILDSDRALNGTINLNNNPNEVLEGGSGNDTIDGGSGNDIITGAYGDDTLSGGIGADIIKGGTGNDVLSGDADNDELYGDAGDDYLDGGDGNDRLNGGSGDDVLDGGPGNDILSGGEGDDIYRWGLGDGNDTINDYDLNDSNNADHQDKLIFGAGIALNDLSWLRSGANLVFTLNETNETVTISSYFTANYQIEAVELADGTALDLAQIEFANDGDGGSVSDTFSLPTDNNNPLAQNDNGSTQENVPVIFTFAELLANDSDEDIGDTLSITAVSAPSNGSVAINTVAQTVTFTPATDYFGSASFDYTVSDDNGGVNTATVTIDITEVVDVNNSPTVNSAIADQAIDEDTSFTFVLPANTFNDQDGDILSLSASLADGSALPSWLNFDTATQTFSGIPFNDDVGELEVQVTADDGNGGSISDTFSLAVSNTNDVPIAAGDSDQTQENTPITLTFVELLANDSDVDVSDSLTITAVANESNGTATINTLAQTITFTPTTDYFGPASFDYTINDGNGGTDKATVSINVTEVGDPEPPIASVIVREWWSNISGLSVASLTDSAAFAGEPDGREELLEFAGPTNIGDNYGSRISGVFIAPTSGEYTFWVSGDDNVELWLSSDELEANKSLVANVPGWTRSLQWGKYSEQSSASITLSAGASYYIEALHKERSGGDNVAVGWQLPGSTDTNLHPICI